MGHAYAGKKLKPRCPKCRSADYEINETFEETVVSSVVNGVMPNEGRYLGLHANAPSVAIIGVRVAQAPSMIS